MAFIPNEEAEYGARLRGVIDEGVVVGLVLELPPPPLPESNRDRS